MRKLVIVVTILFALPAFSAKPVSVKQLEAAIANTQGKTDTQLAHELSDFRLIERLSSTRFAMLEKELPGGKSRQALSALADESAFLGPPLYEIPLNPAPDMAEQRRIMASVVAYVTKSVRQLPNFIARRTTDRFEDTPQIVGPYEPVHFVETSETTVLYRDGREVEDSGTKAPTASNRGLSSHGEFGYILSTVLLDAAQNKLEWMRWEQPSSTTLAVFAFSVPREKSHFELNYCCVADSQGRTRNWHEFVGYSGHMVVDPQNGMIARIVISADLKPGQPVSTARLAVEYGPVEIGGRTYTCPVHSIAFSRAQGLSRQIEKIIPGAAHGQVGGNPTAYVVVGTDADRAEQSLVNDVTFSNYHVFRSESHIVADAGSDQPASTPPAIHQKDTDTAAASSALSNGNKADSPAPTAPSNITVEAAPTPTASGDALAPLSKPAEAAPPEISITNASSLPNIPTSAPSAPDAGYHLRTTSRLVEVTVVAFDKKGRPVTDLKPTDLEIYDNNRKQTVNSFTQAPAETALQPAPKPTEPNAASAEATFTNRPAPTSSTPVPSPQRVTTNTTVFLIDASHVAFGDLTNARREMLRFLKTAPPDEPVGLYILRKYGFQILKEPTTDHADFAATLSKWMPSSQDLAQAQNEEERNRQQMDYIHSVADLSYVNGNLPTGEADMYGPIDPRLRSLGDNPQRDALIYLVWIARHLAATPGHKSLIWVASDNVLADFSDTAPQVERGDKNIDRFALRAREALNDSHVSIYPLDASQLEPGGVGASIQHGNVQVAPGSEERVAIELQTLPPGLRQEMQEELSKSQRDINPGRATAQMHQDTHPIQPAFRELASATGGRALRRAGDIAAELDSIVNDGRAAYTLSFTPDTPADGSYHHLTVKLAGNRNIAFRYRTGYLYEKEPATLKERFQNAVWRPADLSEIALTATLSTNARPATLKLNIAATDLALAQQAGLWIGKLDIFLVQRDDALLHAKLDGQTLAMRLKPSTYEQVLKNGIDIEEPINSLPDTGALRIVVIDENTGRIGTLTMWASALMKKQ